ncbi:MAG: UDP-N-acetylglucosamine 2-epimerase (non-hydrolyzing) [Bacteroidota bacterium]
MKILTIVGARPQFIKAAAVSRAVANFTDVEEVIVHTGQHYDKNMSAIFFDEMHIPLPHHNLNINNLSHGAMTGRMLEGIEGILLKEKPDWVLVYGDTNSTLAGALAASKLHIPLAHVEAGLRSFNTKMPEEINRILTDRISNILFCPTTTAVKNLRNEGFAQLHSKVIQVGDVMYDAALFYADKSRKPNFTLPKNFIIATCHRAENTNDRQRLTNLVNELNTIHREIPIILPLHPRTKKYIQEYELQPHFQIVDPVSYLEMVYLLQHCAMVMTDSGGLQKEAFFFNKPCITLRDETEWVELIEHGVNFLAKIGIKGNILRVFAEVKGRSFDFEKDLYGKGNTAVRIVEELG